MPNENPFKEKMQTLLEKERITTKYLVPGAQITVESQGVDDAALSILEEVILPLDEEDISISGAQESGDTLIFCKIKDKSGKIQSHVFGIHEKAIVAELSDKTGFSFPIIGLLHQYQNEIVTVRKPHQVNGA